MSQSEAPADSFHFLVQEVPADPGYRVVSVRQVVAHNLARARKARGLTQDELGELLTPLTGSPWSRATVSAAESGWEGTTGRVRHFDVDELVAFGIVLRLPVAWFLMPPEEGPRISDDLGPDELPWITTDKRTEGPRLAITSALLRELALTIDDDDDSDRLMRRRIEAEAVGHLWDEVVAATVLRSARDDLRAALGKLAHLEGGASS